MFSSALTIAGSDPSGGAGVQIDLKTFAATGVWGMAVITAVTAQNACRVSGVWAMEPGVVGEQIRTLFEDMRPGAVKTGMLATAGIIKAVVQTLPADIPLVADPVMIASSGQRLLDASATCAVKEILLPRTTLVTPNIPEAEVLAEMQIDGEIGMIKAGERILGLGARAVLVKGGHGTSDESVDLLITRGRIIRLSSPRMQYEVHGSGCCFSAAVAGYLARGCRLEEACRRGKTLVSKAIRDAIPGEGGMRMVNPGGIQAGEEEKTYGREDTGAKQWSDQ